MIKINNPNPKPDTTCKLCGEEYNLRTRKMHDLHCGICGDRYCHIHDCKGFPDKENATRKEKYKVRIGTCNLRRLREDRAREEWVWETYELSSKQIIWADIVDALNNDNIKHYRFVNNNDVVTKVPLWLMGYKHHGDLTYINFYGNIRKLTTWQMIKDKWRGWRSNALDGVADHGMGNYVKHTKGL